MMHSVFKIWFVPSKERLCCKSGKIGLHFHCLPIKRLSQLKEMRDMNWIEIIEVRAIVGNETKLRKYVANLIEGCGEDSKHSIKVYHRSRLEADWCIQLCHHSQESMEDGSALGHHLLSLFKEIGLVRYRLWIEGTTFH